MDFSLKSKWVAALRSGDFKQGSGWLEKDGCYCCLGVLCAIQDSDWKRQFSEEESLYTEKLPDRLNAGLNQIERHELAQINDDGMPFAEIADYIEKTL